VGAVPIGGRATGALLLREDDGLRSVTGAGVKLVAQPASSSAEPTQKLEYTNEQRKGTGRATSKGMNGFNSIGFLKICFKADQRLPDCKGTNLTASSSVAS
jgi:hypothetical protein